MKQFISECQFLLTLLASVLISCQKSEVPQETGKTSIVLSCNPPASKSADPDQWKISDVNIFVFNKDLLLESSHYLKAGDAALNGSGFRYSINLLEGCCYNFYVCANTGFRIRAETLGELLGFRFHLAYPDDYRIGMPMSGILRNHTVHKDEDVTIPIMRTMAKISVRIDRSNLSKDVEFNVKGLKICGCPKSVSMLTENSVESRDDIFISGFSKTGVEADALNQNEFSQTSREVSLFTFENMQGMPLGNIRDYGDKFFVKDDPLSWKCSYVELYADYISPDFQSVPGGSLIYRHYIGESPSDFNVRRNCHYHLTFTPCGDGLGGNGYEGSGWRVDKTDIDYIGEKYMKIAPGNYIKGKIGDIIHIRCNYKPEFAPFDIGLEELEYDKARGIYDYRIDPDGKGVTLTLKESGSGLLYFETGDPINEAEMIVIVSDP